MVIRIPFSSSGSRSVREGWALGQSNPEARVRTLPDQGSMDAMLRGRCDSLHRRGRRYLHIAHEMTAPPKTLVRSRVATALLARLDGARFLHQLPDGCGEEHDGLLSNPLNMTSWPLAYHGSTALSTRSSTRPCCYQVGSFRLIDTDRQRHNASHCIARRGTTPNRNRNIGTSPRGIRCVDHPSMWLCGILRTACPHAMRPPSCASPTSMHRISCTRSR